MWKWISRVFTDLGASARLCYSSQLKGKGQLTDCAIKKYRIMKNSPLQDFTRPIFGIFISGNYLYDQLRKWMKAKCLAVCIDNMNALCSASTAWSGTHWHLPAGWMMLVCIMTYSLGSVGSAENNMFLLCRSPPSLSAPLMWREVSPPQQPSSHSTAFTAFQARVVLIWLPSKNATLL